MFCQLTGHACVDPVVSKTGGIFERRLIESHIDIKGNCPITGQPLTKDDLIAIKSHENEVIAPRTAATTSAPSLLKALQIEWDSAMLETHDLKVQNARLQQELASALYNHDAACRVVARLLKENRELRAKMTAVITAAQDPGSAKELLSFKSELQAMDTSTDDAVRESQNVSAENGHHSASPIPGASGPASAASPPGIVAPQGQWFQTENLRKQFAETLQKTSELLSATRKQRKTPSTATVDFLSALQPSPGNDTPYMGISLIKIVQPEAENVSHLVIAGKTRGIVLYEYPSLIPVPTWPVKQSKVTQLDVLVHDSTNPVILVVRKESVSVVGTDKIIYTATLEEPVTSVAAHPSGEFFATLTTANAIHMHHVESRTTIFRVSSVPADVRSIKFHPDGMLLAAATSSAVHIFSAIRGESAAELNNFSAITMMTFSENGFHLATADHSGHVHIWDLRKLLVTFTLNVPAAPAAIQFDYTGNYLAVAHPIGDNNDTSAVSIFAFHAKAWTLVGSGPIFVPRAHPISDISWGLNSEKIILVSPESRQIHFLG